MKYHVENIVKKQSSGGNNGYRNGNFNRNIIKIITTIIKLHVGAILKYPLGGSSAHSKFPIGSGTVVGQRLAEKIPKPANLSPTTVIPS